MDVESLTVNIDRVIEAVNKYITSEQFEIFEKATGQELWEWIEPLYPTNIVAFKGIKFAEWLDEKYGDVGNTYDKVAFMGDDFSKLFREVLVRKPMFAIAIM